MVPHSASESCRPAPEGMSFSISSLVRRPHFGNAKVGGSIHPTGTARSVGDPYQKGSGPLSFRMDVRGAVSPKEGPDV
jgi:hypothetical protein